MSQIPKHLVVALICAVLATATTVRAQIDLAPQPSFPANARAAMALSDVDNDGDIDLVTADSVLDNVYVFLNNGDGTFAPPTGPMIIPIASGIRALAAGDVNGDTLADILIALPGSLAGSNGTISVLLNQGGGLFAAPSPQTILVPAIMGEQVTPTAMVIADLDGIGNLDVGLATVLLNTTGQPGFVSVVLNTGVDAQMQPVFANSVNIDALDSSTKDIVAADFDQDGSTDLAVANSLGNSVNSVSVVLNEGTPSFGSANRRKLGGTITSAGRLIAGPVDADAFPDLVTINQSHSYSVLFNDGLGRFNGNTQFPLGSQDVTPLDIPTCGSLADIDGDGDLDLVAGLAGTSGGLGSLVVLPNDGAGLFGAELPFASMQDHTFLSVADIDGDNDLDVVSVDVPQGTATVLRNLRFPVVDIALRVVASPTVVEDGALPVGLTQVCPGTDFIVEVWVSQVDGGLDGIAEGSVDLVFDPMVATANSVDHGSIYNSTVFPSVIDNAGGLIDDLGGTVVTAIPGPGISPNWALLARVNMSAIGTGAVSFQLAPGAFPFELAGALLPLAVEVVNVSAAVNIPVSVVDDLIACTIDTCNPATGAITHVPTASLCDDFDVCTDDSCDVLLDCQNVNNSASCDDGDVCTTADICSLGICTGGPPLNCNDGDVCTDDSCDMAMGCQHADNVALCDDGDACTTGDVCSAGFCVGGAAPSCDDSNVCTVDTCVSPTGCVNRHTLYDLDRSGTIDLADLALFAPHFATFDGDLLYFDCADFFFDGVTDASDVSFFGTAIGKACDDNTMVFPGSGSQPPPSCPTLFAGTSAALSDSVQVFVVAVALRSSSQRGFAVSPPDSLRRPVDVGTPFVVELWTRMYPDIADGLTGGTLDFSFDPSIARVNEALVDSNFGLFALGSAKSAGVFETIGGGTIDGGMGVGEWVRFATVNMEAIQPGDLDIRVSAGRLGFAQFGRGAISEEAVLIEGVTVRVRGLKVSRERKPARD